MDKYTENESPYIKWLTLLFIMYVIVGIIYRYVTQDVDDPDYIYSCSVPIGDPIIEYYENGMMARSQESVGITIKLDKTKDTFTYINNEKFNINDACVETEDGKIILELKPSDKTETGELFLSVTERICVRNQKTNLVCTIDGKKITRKLSKIYINPKFNLD